MLDELLLPVGTTTKQELADKRSFTGLIGMVDIRFETLVPKPVFPCIRGNRGAAPQFFLRLHIRVSDHLQFKSVGGGSQCLMCSPSHKRLKTRDGARFGGPRPIGYVGTISQEDELALSFDCYDLEISGIPMRGQAMPPGSFEQSGTGPSMTWFFESQTPRRQPGCRPSSPGSPNSIITEYAFCARACRVSNIPLPQEQRPCFTHRHQFTAATTEISSSHSLRARATLPIVALAGAAPAGSHAIHNAFIASK